MIRSVFCDYALIRCNFLRLVVVWRVEERLRFVVFNALPKLLALLLLAKWLLMTLNVFHEGQRCKFGGGS